MKQIAVGHHREALQMEFGKAVLAELVLTFLFAFAGVGACIAAGFNAHSYQAGLTAGTSLMLAAVAHAFVVFAMISAGLHVSGAHFNPAVTLGLAVGGHVTLLRTASYWLAQLAGSTLACLLLSFLTGGAAMPVHDLTVGMSPARGVVMEAVMTFSLLFVVYGALVDPRSREMRVVGPLSVGLVVGANVLAGGSYTGASMNPARSFGPAVVAGLWAHHWIDWVGPLLGGGLAGLFFENVLMGPLSHVPVGQEF